MTLTKKANTNPVPTHDCARYNCNESTFVHSPTIYGDAAGITTYPESARTHVAMLAYDALKNDGHDAQTASAILRAAGL